MTKDGELGFSPEGCGSWRRLALELSDELERECRGRGRSCGALVGQARRLERAEDGGDWEDASELRSFCAAELRQLEAKQEGQFKEYLGTQCGPSLAGLDQSDSWI